MAVLSPTDSFEKLEVKLPKALKQRAKSYMAYANIQSIDELIEKSIEFVFDSDKVFKKSERKSSKKKG